MTWFAIMTKPQQEFRAVEALQRMTINAQCPLVIEIRARRRRNAMIRQEVGKPMFRGYIFVEAEYIPHWFSNEPWFIMPLPSKSDPRSIASDLVENALQSSGEITLDEWRQVQRFAAGDSIKLKSGIPALVKEVRGKKLLVLAKLLSKDHRIEVDQDQVEIA